MERDDLLALVRFHAWANDRIVATAEGLTDEELRRPDVLDRGSAFDTFRHLVDVDWSWRQFLLGSDIGETYVWDTGVVLDDLSAIRAFSIEEDQELRRYVERLDRATLHEPRSMSDDPNDALPRWLIVAHIVNHGTQHRSELAHYLTRCGHSPGDLDLLDAFTVPWPGGD